jgi:putative protease
MPKRRPAAALQILTRSLLQTEVAVETALADLIYCDFEDVRRSKEAVAICRSAGVPVALATPRIIKPGEDGLLQQVAVSVPDAVLIRNLAALGWFRDHHPELPLLGDYSLNVTNELTAALFIQEGVQRLVPGYDLNLQQLRELLARIEPGYFEVVLHQHLPMFHMEHCVFSHVLSNGKDFHDCGRPCDRHQVDLRDHVGESHPLAADVGCRNTVFNAHAQSAAPYLPQLREWGVRHFRVELLRESAEETRSLLETYSRVLTGEASPPTTWSQLRVLNQLGVTRGTLEFA